MIRYFVLFLALCGVLSEVNGQTCSQLNVNFQTNGTPCAGNPTVLQFTGSTQFNSNLKWFVGSTQIGTGVNLTYTFATAGSYSVKIQGTSGSCTKSFSKSVTVQSNSSVGPISGNATPFTSLIYNYKVPALSGGTFNWWTNGDATIVSGGSTNSAQIRFNSFGSGTTVITCQYVSAGGCTTQSTYTVRKGVCSDLSLSITSGAACLNNPTSFQAGGSLTELGNFSWTVDGTSSGTGATLTKTFSSLGAHTIVLTGKTTDNTCSKTATVSIVIPKGIGGISGATKVVPNSTQVYKIDSAATGTYTWTSTSGGQVISGQNTSSATFQFGSGIPGSFVVTANYTSPGGCTSQRNLNISTIPSFRVKPTGKYSILGNENLNPFNTSANPPSKPQVFDRRGERKLLKDIAIPNNSELAGMFRLHFEDEDKNTQKGFNDPQYGAARKAVVIQVYKDISKLLGNNFPNPYPGVSYPCSSPSATDCRAVEINVELSEYTTLDFYAYASQWYLDAGTGISYGTAWQYITTGFDPYYNLTNPSYHGRLGVNFNPSINWNTSLTANAAPGVSTDMYTTILHEALHMLGMGSFIGSNKISLQTNSDLGIYSLWDTFLKSNGQSLLKFNLDADCYNSSSNPAVPNTAITTCPGVSFVGPNNIPTNTIYAPATYETGSSLSHLNCGPNETPGYVMDAGGSLNDGYTQRTPHLTEVQILCALGYSISGNYGGDYPLSTKSYSNSCPKTRIVAGTNDFRPYSSNGTGTDYIVIAGKTISLTTVLSNDINATAISCLEVASGKGTFSAVNATSFSYTPEIGYGGQHVLRYRPQNALGQKGNITYIFIYVQPAVETIPECGAPNPNACNLVCNGSFEDGVSATNPNNINNYGFNWTTKGWGELLGSPDLYIRDNINPGLGVPFNVAGIANFASGIPIAQQSINMETHNGPPNNRYIGLFDYDKTEYYLYESVYGKLTQPLLTGRSYKVKAWVRISTKNWPTPNITAFSTQIRISVNNGVPTPAFSVVPLTNGTYSQVIYETPSSNLITATSGWVMIEGTFAATGPYDYITIEPLVSKNHSANYILIDDVSIEPADILSVKPTISQPDPCLGTNLTLSYQLCYEKPGTNTDPISLSLTLPAGVSLVSGDFGTQGTYSIPANRLTPSNNCITLTATVSIGQTTSTLAQQDILLNVVSQACVPEGINNKVKLSFKAKKCDGLAFDGIDDYVTIPITNFTPTNSSADVKFTVQITFNPDNTGSNTMYLMSFQNYSLNNSFSEFSREGLFKQLDGKFGASFFFPGIEGSTGIPSGTCTSLRTTSPNTLGDRFYVGSFYINGVLYTQPRTANPFSYQLERLLIGTDWQTLQNPQFGTGYFKGSISDIRLWGGNDPVLTPVLTGNEPGLLGYWKMNEISGQTIFDYSIYGNHGYRGSTPQPDVNDPSFGPKCAVIVNQRTENSDQNSGSSISAELETDIIPNPFSNEASLVLKKAGQTANNTVHLTVVDAQGITVFSKENHLIEEAVTLGSEWKAGMYFVLINDLSKTYTYKVVKR